MRSVRRSLQLVGALFVSLSVTLTVAPAPAQTTDQPAPGDQQVPAERPTISPRVAEFVKAVAESPDDDEFVKKLKERHNVAVKLFEARIAEYRRNVGDLLQVLDAARLVIEAKLDLAPDRDAQLEVYQQAHEVAHMVEAHFQKLRDAGLGAASDLERAKLARLNVEIQILKLKRQQP